MKARLKQKRVFQHQSRTGIPPETSPDQNYNDYKYHYDEDYTVTNENISATPRGDIRSKYF